MPRRLQSIASHRVAGLAAVLAVMVALGVVAITLMSGLQARTDALAHHNLPRVEALGQIGAKASDYRLLQLRYVYAVDPALARRVENRLAQTSLSLDALLARYVATSPPDEQTDAQAVVGAWRRFRAHSESALALARAGRRAEADVMLRGSPDEAAFARVHDLVSEARATERAEGVATLGAGRRDYRRSLTIFLSGLVATVVVCGSLGFWLLVVRPARRAALAERFRRQLGQAVEMADTEAEALAVVGKALTLAAASHPAELLLADSSQSHLRAAVAVGGSAGTGPGCGVDSPRACLAVRRGQAVSFPSSEALDACPKLVGRADGPCSAFCVPVTVLGRAIGVLHTTGTDGEPIPVRHQARVESTAELAGSRLGVIRAMGQSQLQASTDPLTGLLNRRSLDDRVLDMRREGVPFIAAMGDLDHFKPLNDTYGHETGDRALRLFARCLAEAVRSQDVVARYGGEEFVVVMPRCSSSEAAEVMERVRERLRGVLATAEVPSFTFSAGLAESSPDQTLNETLQAADAALLEAKRSGRDRTLISSGIGA